VLAAAICCVPAHADDQGLPPLSRHGKNYESTCSEQNLLQLKKSLLGIEVKSRDQAWKAITVLLCGEVTSTNRRYVTGLLTPRVEVSFGNIDDDPTPKLVKRNELRSEDLFARGIAYGAGIADMPNELTVVYYRDEACVGGKKLRYIAHRWRLAGVSLGCD
jgi:hypothetical protein